LHQCLSQGISRQQQCGRYRRRTIGELTLVNDFLSGALGPRS
jgi:hypothetical protein